MRQLSLSMVVTIGLSAAAAQAHSATVETLYPANPDGTYGDCNATHAQEVDPTGVLLTSELGDDPNYRLGSNPGATGPIYRYVPPTATDKYWNQCYFSDFYGQTASVVTAPGQVYSRPTAQAEHI